ncbi:MAG: HupE/UreJ family protein, partial [Bacteroidota bacterium]
RAILGKDHSIITQLLAFNLGLEYGQIIVVVLFLIFSYILVDWAKVARRDWNLILSSAIAGIALILIKDRL